MFLAVLLLTIGLPLRGGGADERPAYARLPLVECKTALATSPSPGATTIPSAAAPTGGGPAEFPPGGGALTVFAAASLTDAFEQIKTDLEAAHGGLTIAYNFAGTQALVTQLKEGAEADVFAPANYAQMETASENGSIMGEPVTFVRNRLAIVVPVDNPADVQTPADLGKEGVRLVLAQAEVPVGRYAREAICKMGQEREAFREGFVERVGANIVSEEEDVRDVLTKVQLGEADAGVVYVSDAAGAGDRVQTINIPTEINVIATYPISPVKGGDAVLADAFIGYVLGPEGQGTLQRYGFDPVT